MGESFQCVLVHSWCIYISPLKFYFRVSRFKFPILSRKPHRIWIICCQDISCCREVLTFVESTPLSNSPLYHFKKQYNDNYDESHDWRPALLYASPPHRWPYIGNRLLSSSVSAAGGLLLYLAKLCAPRNYLGNLIRSFGWLPNFLLFLAQGDYITIRALVLDYSNEFGIIKTDYCGSWSWSSVWHLHSPRFSVICIVSWSPCVRN
jgi:hypothetical protein